MVNRGRNGGGLRLGISDLGVFFFVDMMPKAKAG